MKHTTSSKWIGAKRGYTRGGRALLFCIHTVVLGLRALHKYLIPGYVPLHVELLQPNSAVLNI